MPTRWCHGSSRDAVVGCDSGTGGVSGTGGDGGTSVDSGTSVDGGSLPVADAIIVSSTGDDQGAGTLSSPCRTVDRAQSVASAGSTIYLLAGDYAGTINISKSGATGNPITDAAYHLPIASRSPARPARSAPPT